MFGGVNDGNQFWNVNVGVLQSRFPRVAELVQRSGLQGNVCSFAAKDGAPAYGIRRDGKIQPVTNPVNPLTKINEQLKQWADKLQDFTRPVLILGVHPGMEILHVFNLRENASSVLCKQPLWICVDSLPAFVGFLNTYDAEALLSSPRVELFVKEDMPARVDWLRANPQFPYLFSMVSVSPPPVQQAVLAPLAQLIQERSALVKKYQEENDAYYADITDEQLAENLSGQAGRKPRLLVPTCPWSSVIQYSIRDTVSAFKRAGWETMVLDSPAMLTPHYAMESINQFKPDLFLYINHLRQEVAGVVPENLMMVSWIQDPLPHVNNVDAAKKWNEITTPRKRDLIVGYTGQLKPYGYNEERLHPLSMIVDTEIFKPRELTPEQIEKYGCDVMFASNSGMPTERRVKENLVPMFEDVGWDEATLMEFHDKLWDYYRAGNTITSYQQLINFLQLDATPEETRVQNLFWRLNDTIYRHVVIEWLDEYAQENSDFKLHLYGKGWEEHPRFAKYAKGELAHGEELSVAYQAAKQCLHLNAVEGEHQRVLEIFATGGRLLLRNPIMSKEQQLVDHHTRHIFDSIDNRSGLVMTPGLSDFVFILLEPQGVSCMTEQTDAPLTERLNDLFFKKLSWLDDSWDDCRFSSAQDLSGRLQYAAAGNRTAYARVLQLTDRFIEQQLSNAAISLLSFAQRRKTSLAVGAGLRSIIRLVQAIYNRPPQEVMDVYDQVQCPGAEIKLYLSRYLLEHGCSEAAVNILSSISSQLLSAKQNLTLASIQSMTGNIEEAHASVARAYGQSGTLTNGYADVGRRSAGIRDARVYFDGLEMDRKQERLHSTSYISLAQQQVRCGNISEAEQTILAAYAKDTGLKGAFAHAAFHHYGNYLDFHAAKEIWIREPLERRCHRAESLLYTIAHFEEDEQRVDQRILKEYESKSALKGAYSQIALQYLKQGNADKALDYYSWDESLSKSSIGDRGHRDGILWVVSGDTPTAVTETVSPDYLSGLLYALHDLQQAGCARPMESEIFHMLGQLVLKSPRLQEHPMIPAFLWGKMGDRQHVESYLKHITNVHRRSEFLYNLLFFSGLAESRQSPFIDLLGKMDTVQLNEGARLNHILTLLYHGFDESTLREWKTYCRTFPFSFVNGFMRVPFVRILAKHGGYIDLEAALDQYSCRHSLCSANRTTRWIHHCAEIELPRQEDLGLHTLILPAFFENMLARE